MKKFGFSRKSDKAASSASDNPYAQQAPADDPYASGPQSVALVRGYPPVPEVVVAALVAPGPRPAPPQQSNSYGSQNQGYGSDKYGSGGGYGGNRYDNGGGQSQSSSSSRPGGYGGVSKGDSDSYGGRSNYSQSSQPSYGSSGSTGGRYGGGNDGRGQLGRNDSTSTEANRGDLFGGAQNRYNAERGNAYRDGPPQNQNQGDQRFGQGKSAVSAVDSGPYGGSQGERLQNAERNMDLADNYNAVGLDKTKELQTVNRSMFSVHVANPFTAKKRAAARDQEVMDRHRSEKDQREATRRAHYEESQAVEQSFRGMDLNQQPAPSYARPTRENNKFIFAEEDSDEERKEDAINNNLDEMFHLTTTLKSLATQTGSVLDQQNRVIDRIGAKTDRVDDGVKRNRNELDKIR
ncbi:unnamed protein product [Parascedosporium putredinis]|uniref:t-SNARE coiled-coil homology domain-containing protein n=1 Tax=Parascedosporium putredinis TaxID=1442378 RepID=A0A9P1H4I7_9PEZI|nr:unnamed protein product [Parascedosporium putredinis]CAI7998327.1 unnamed protein product [Parascedosporium putredinis]